MFGVLWCNSFCAAFLALQEVREMQLAESGAVVLSALGPVVVIFLLAALAEGLVEYLVAPWLEGLKGATEKLENVRVMALRYISALVGIGLSLVYGADLLAIFGVEAGVPYVGSVLTGVLIGRGSNYVHDFVGKWLTPEGR
jgi:hypothetical protein